jgi:hypothetical protein
MSFPRRPNFLGFSRSNLLVFGLCAFGLVVQADVMAAAGNHQPFPTEFLTTKGSTQLAQIAPGRRLDGQLKAKPLAPPGDKVPPPLAAPKESTDARKPGILGGLRIRPAPGGQDQEEGQRPEPRQPPESRPERPQPRTDEPPHVEDVNVVGYWICEVREHTLINQSRAAGYKLVFGEMHVAFTSNNLYQSRATYRLTAKNADSGWQMIAEWGSYTTNGPSIIFRIQGEHPVAEAGTATVYSGLAYIEGDQMEVHISADGSQGNLLCKRQE